MKRPGDLIDYLLNELPPEEAHAVAERIARDPETAAARDLYAEAIGLVREAAAEGWEAPAAGRARVRWLRPALAVAAVLLAAVGLFLLDGASPHARRVFDPDGAFGYLLPEEVDAAGRVHAAGATGAFRLQAGKVEVAGLGSERAFPLAPGESIAPESHVRTPADAGARIDLPHGGILFIGPLSEVRLRHHRNGEAALRLMSGLAYAVAGTRTLHLAVDETDLLLDHEDGAALLRFKPAETICLRGNLFLRLADGERFKVPESERLPAACAKEPRTAPARYEELALEDWYLPLVYASWRSECVMWTEPGRSEPLDGGPETLLYVRVVPERSGELAVSFGGAPRRFEMHAKTPLELRLKLSDLGPGPRLQISPAAAVRQARLFEATPR